MKARKRSYTQAYVQGLLNEILGLRERVEFLQSHLSRQTEILARLTGAQTIEQRVASRRT